MPMMPLRLYILDQKLISGKEKNVRYLLFIFIFELQSTDKLIQICVYMIIFLQTDLLLLMHDSSCIIPPSILPGT